MRGFQTKLDVIGNNIANVNTPGFKKSRVIFQDILSQTVAGATAPGDENGGVNPRQIGLGTKIASIDTIHTQGSPMTTNLPTDVTIEGDAYFVVSPAEDGPRYFTRAGNFTRDAEGNLVTANGHFVLSEGEGIINIPREEFTSFSISQNGDVVATNVDGETEIIDTIGTAVFSNPGGLKKVGSSLYEVTANANPEGEFEILPITENLGGEIIAGQLEMSNVDLTEEFTEMIVAQRGFQSNSRIITTSDEILQEVVNLKR